MSIPSIVLDAQTLKLIIGITSGLLLISMVRIIFLLRTHNRLKESTAKMEKQVLVQQQEILAVRQDSNAWRGEMQRMFDAFRAEYSNRLSESEQRYEEIQKRREAIPPTGVEPTTRAVTPPASDDVKSDGLAETMVLPVPAIAATEA